MTYRLLLAIQDTTTRTFLADNLNADGYSTELATDHDLALARLREETIDLVIVDIDGQTLALVDELRDAAAGALASPSDTPVIALRAGAGELECVRLLERGCDDVLVTPFFYPELRARVAVILRRTLPRQPRLVTIAGPLRIDHAARAVELDGRAVILSAIEYRLLCQLASEPTRVFTREELLRDVWGYRCQARTRTLDTHVHRLRRHLGADDPDGQLIHNVWGVGYRLMITPA